MSTLRIATNCSAEFLPHAAAMLRSALDHRADRDLEAIMLVGDDMPRESIDRLAAMYDAGGATLRAVPMPDELIAPLPEPRQPWYRIFLPELLDDPRVLYLDADAIVMDDLWPLWTTDLGGLPLGAVSNISNPWDRGFPESVGLPEFEFLNSGVLLMDLETMRAQDATAELVAKTLEDPRVHLADQTVLSQVFAGRWLHLHPRWNTMNSLYVYEHAADAFGAEAVREALRRPGVRHFEGPGENKPWHILYPRSDRRAYLKARRRTPWPRVQREGLTARNLARRAVRGVRRRSPV